LKFYNISSFDSVYLDDDVKVAKDIQGNCLIVDLAPYSWELVYYHHSQ